MPAIELDVEAGDWPASTDWQALAEEAIAAAAAEAGIRLRPSALVSVLLADDATVRGLNAEWRGLDKPTNVLSFQSVPADRLKDAHALGDIVLAAETVAREAAAEGKSFRQHATHLLVHGFLHLLGFDHAEPAQAEAMEALERRIMTRLGLPDPYEGSDLLPEAGAA